MHIVNIHEAKTQLSRLITKGEPFIIARAGKPLVKVLPVDAPTAARRLGFMSGEITVPQDFDRMASAEIEQRFCGQQ
jgi:antitoxin (DNA-binding transcriptional repressor) of toxin-antitoxin stability system